jgi:transposase-like protein
MKDEDAYRWFLRARWPSTKGVPVCPDCGVIGATAIRRRRFRCTAIECRREFSVTSGTILASRKLSFRRLVLAIALSVLSVKGLAACHLKRELTVDYKTAFVLSHKLREAVAAEREHMKLEGTVEMDAMHLGGHVRPENKAEDRVDGRHAENQTGKRMAVQALRERGPGNRTLAAAVPGERADLAWHLTRNHVAPGAELRADQHSAYDELGGLGNLVRNDHTKAYVVERDASTNQAESLFSRMRRAEIGIFHRMSGKYLDWYAADIAWREDMRRIDYRRQAKSMLASAMKHGVSPNMCGYWQRRDKAKEVLVGWNPLSGMLS